MIEPNGPARVPPRLIVLAGLPGTGKSTVARSLMDRVAGIWLRVDTVEAGLLKAGIPRSFETGLAAYVVAADIARTHLQLGRDAIIDAVNGVEEARSMWRELATECHARRYVIETVCSDEAEHRRRVESRADPTPPLPAPTWAQVRSRDYRPWDEPTLTWDTARPFGEGLGRAYEYLGLGSSGTTIEG